MDKIQIIERLFYHITSYSYLIIPLAFIISKQKKGVSAVIGAYGAIVFFYLYSFYDWDKSIQRQLIPLFTLFEYLIFSYFLWTSVEAKRKLFIVACSVLFTFFVLFFRAEIFRLDTIPVGIETILLFIYIILFFYDYSKNASATMIIYKHKIFWISVGILAYLGGSFFFNIYADALGTAEFDKYWSFTYVLEIIKNILFVVAILIPPHKESHSNIRKKVPIPYLDIDVN